ncbi:hypothetical protein Q1695_011913 [Nippostrongylus brasiliensis]|nr:hypothetical protein Q1695_011913 [Nippostrongylus brasiliensis]
MSLLHTVVFLIGIVSVVTASLHCYAGTTALGGAPPTTVTCPGTTTFCKKTISIDGKTATYHCDNELHCTKTQCFVASDSRQMCCCKGSYCNSTSKTSIAFGLLTVIMTRVLSF